MGKIKKVFGVTSKIIRWVWRVILLLLLILCIVFQTPLKVLALVAIFLLACTALPLRYRKWFWAGVGVIVLVLVLWVFAPEKEGDWKPLTFDKELAALEAKNKIPDEENAAGIYNKLIADYNKSDFEPNFIDYKTESEYWSAKDYPQAAKWIKSHKETINKLMQASEFEKCKFDVQLESMFFSEIDRLGALRRWAMLLSRAGNNDITEKRIDQGLKKYYCVLQMGKHLCQQSSLVEILVGMALKPIAIERFNNFVISGHLNKKQLDAIERLINEVKYNWQSDLPRVLDYEKLLSKNMFGLFYEVNTKGQFRFTHDPSKAVRTLSPGDFNEIPQKNCFQKKLAKAGCIINWFFMPATPQKLAEMIDSAHQKYYEMADPNFDWSRKPKPTEFPMSPMSSFILEYKLNYKYVIKMLADMEESIYYNIHDFYLRGDSSKRGTSLLIALRRYKDKNGFWPENLDEIKGLTNEENFIDPVNDQFFVYKLTGDSFTLYSKGKNGIDDNGKYSSKFDDKTFKVINTEDDIRIWPLKQCQKESPTETYKEPNNTQRD